MCIKNQKKFWFIEYYGSCDYKINYVKASGIRGTFFVSEECSKCSAERDSLASSEDLISEGYDAKKLSTMSTYVFSGKRPEDLK